MLFSIFWYSCKCTLFFPHPWWFPTLGAFFIAKYYAIVFFPLGYRPPLSKCRSRPCFPIFHSVSRLLYSRVSCPSPGFPHIPAFLSLSTLRCPNVIFFGFLSDYLLSRIESLPSVVDELNSTFTSYQKDHKGGTQTFMLTCFNYAPSPQSLPKTYRWVSCLACFAEHDFSVIVLSDAIPCACCLGSFSHQLSECILNAKATSHMAPTQEASGQSSKSYSFCLYSKQESLKIEWTSASVLYYRSGLTTKASWALKFRKIWTFSLVKFTNLDMSIVICLRDNLLSLLHGWTKENFCRFSSFNTVRPPLSGHPRDFEKWPLNGGWRLINPKFNATRTSSAFPAHP